MGNIKKFIYDVKRKIIARRIKKTMEISNPCCENCHHGYKSSFNGYIGCCLHDIPPVYHVTDHVCRHYTPDSHAIGEEQFG